jgi:breakpoint cluster region protein
MLVPVTSDTDKKLQMRKWVVTSILDSEHNYVNMLGVLLQYMRSFQAVASTSQPLISAEDTKSIFYKIPELHEIHSRFIHELEPRVEAWSAEQEVGETFKMLALEEYPIAAEYLKNYQSALATIQRCAQENPQFQELTKVIKCKGINESSSLEEILHKPVVRIQRNTLVLHDLIQCTPTSHADYDILQKTLKITHHFLENLKNPMEVDNADQQYLVKNTLVVERVGNKRKLRHMFLFNNIIVCTKQKIGGGRKLHFEIRWSIPLAELEIDAKSSPQEEKKLEESRRQEINQLQQKIGQLQSELRTEIRRSKLSTDSNTRTWSIRGANRNIDKIKKKLVEQEASLLLASPHLLLKLKGKQKTYTMLLSSDYERNEWVETIKGLKSKVQGTGSLAGVDINNLVNSLQLPKVDALSSIMDREDFGIDEEQMFGALNVTIHRVQGLKKPCDVFCTMEVDSYGHFFMKAKTNIMCHTTDATWNQDFEIDLDSAQTLRVLCYQQEGERNVLLGKCALELSKAWLRGDFQEKTIFLNEGLHLMISLRYVSREQTLKRTPSSSKGGLFGVKISSTTRREHTKVPLIITTCVEEVERRGLEDLGIYRVSGVSSEIQRLKKAFERNSKGAIPLAKEVDIHVVTSLLKLYLRELPEALFTDIQYPRFIDGMGLADPEAKTTCMTSLIRALPEPNYSTAKYLIDHIVKVSQHQDKNKMSLNNLATVFGPTLLRPAVKEEQPMTMDLFSAGARDAMLQTGILFFFLSLRAGGEEL